MATTWMQFRTDTKKLLTDVTASNDLFASACAAYVKSMVCREVDHDLLLSKSYWNYYTDMRRRLLGFATSLIPGSTLDTAVRVYLPVDAEREGIQTYITQQIKNAYLEVTGFSTLLDKLIREAVIDMQSYVPCYRIGVETRYTSTDVVNVGNMSRGKMPQQAELREGFFLLEVAALAQSVTYKVGDFVSSNGRIYEVLSDGQLAASSLGSGLQTTDGSIETLGGMNFVFYYGEACFRSNLVVRPWEDRYKVSYYRDGCRGDRNMPALIFIDKEAFSFYVWPKLDSTHTISLFWTGLDLELSDGDSCPFDETLQQAAREYVLMKYFNQVESSPTESKMHGMEYNALRQRAFVDCRQRQMLEFK